MNVINRFFQRIKNCLKHVLPPPTKSFMREINFIKQAIECLNKNVDSAMKSAAEKEQVQLRILRQEIDTLKNEIQTIKSLQRESGEQLSQLQNALGKQFSHQQGALDEQLSQLQDALGKQFSHQQGALDEQLSQLQDALGKQFSHQQGALDEQLSRLQDTLGKQFSREQSELRGQLFLQQGKLGEQLSSQLKQQTALLQEVSRNMVEERKETDSKITAVVRRCNTLDNREKRLVQDKRLLEQVVLGEVPNFSSVSLELTNHCAYNCVFCPREQMTRARGIMSDESIHIVAQRLGVQANKNIVVWTDGMGEVMLLNEFFDKIRLIKSVMPNALPYVVTTLGYEKEDSYWDTFLQVGIKRVLVSIYGYDRETYQLLHSVDRYELVKSNLNLLMAKNQALGSPVEIKVNIESFGKDFFSSFDNFDYDYHVQLREQFVNEIKDDPATMILKRTIHNRGQAFHFAEPRRGVKKCFIDSYPTRQGKLYVTWDLNVLPCPMIFNNEIVFGNLRDQSLEEIYSSELYKDFLKNLQTGELKKYPSCQNCNM